MGESGVEQLFLALQEYTAHVMLPNMVNVSCFMQDSSHCCLLTALLLAGSAGV